MTRNLKALGLAAIAVLAMGALAASAAQATNAKITTTGGEYPAVITQTQTGALTAYKIGTGVRSIHCETATLSTTINGPANHATFTPTYANCTATGVPRATVTMNGCTYTLRSTSTLSGTTANGSVELICPGGSKVEVHIYETIKLHEENKPLCTFDQSPTGKPYPGTITFHNKAEDVEAQVNLKEIPTLNTIGPALLCGAAAGATVNSTLIGNQTIQATVAGVPKALMIG